MSGEQPPRKVSPRGPVRAGLGAPEEFPDVRPEEACDVRQRPRPCLYFTTSVLELISLKISACILRTTFSRSRGPSTQKCSPPGRPSRSRPPARQQLRRWRRPSLPQVNRSSVQPFSLSDISDKQRMEMEINQGVNSIELLKIFLKNLFEIFLLDNCIEQYFLVLKSQKDFSKRFSIILLN